MNCAPVSCFFGNVVTLFPLKYETPDTCVKIIAFQQLLNENTNYFAALKELTDLQCSLLTCYSIRFHGIMSYDVNFSLM